MKRGTEGAFQPKFSPGRELDIADHRAALTPTQLEASLVPEALREAVQLAESWEACPGEGQFQGRKKRKKGVNESDGSE